MDGGRGTRGKLERYLAKVVERRNQLLQPDPEDAIDTASEDLTQYKRSRWAERAMRPAERLRRQDHLVVMVVGY